MPEEAPVAATHLGRQRSVCSDKEWGPSFNVQEGPACRDPGAPKHCVKTDHARACPGTHIQHGRVMSVALWHVDFAKPTHCFLEVK